MMKAVLEAPFSADQQCGVCMVLANGGKPCRRCAGSILSEIQAYKNSIGANNTQNDQVARR